MKTRWHLIRSIAVLGALGCGGAAAPSAGASAPSNAAPTTGAATDSSAPKLPDHPDSDKVTWKKDSPPKNCHTSAHPGDLIAGTTAMASACVNTSRMHQVGQPMTGQGQVETLNTTASGMITTLPFKAQGNHCYRFFGLAEPTVTDLDITVMDSTGKSAGEDLNDSNEAIVLEDGAVCFKQDDNVNLNVAVANGKGKWVVEVWSD